ncbi:unnamed protein product [Pieris macdunnoughi]|uniref:Uncharacterized protein n=1 Tax=Pieris macdunnoughi TaxID=345717 RepID=A0A821QLT4_9NEOP|nr:unnamed protein product [Pieris macdunnoughi]
MFGLYLKLKLIRRQGKIQPIPSRSLDVRRSTTDRLSRQLAAHPLVEPAAHEVFPANSTFRVLQEKSVQFPERPATYLQSLLALSMGPNASV